MTDAEILAYLLSHAPLERFYVFQAPDGGALMKYFDENGRAWNIMEDDEETAASAVEFLRRSGVKIFDSYPRLMEFERSITFGSN